MPLPLIALVVTVVSILSISVVRHYSDATHLQIENVLSELTSKGNDVHFTEEVFKPR